MKYSRIIGTAKYGQVVDVWCRRKMAARPRSADGVARMADQEARRGDSQQGQEEDQDGQFEDESNASMTLMNRSVYSVIEMIGRTPMRRRCRRNRSPKRKATK